MDPIADGLVNLKNCEMVGKKECVIKPASKLMGNLLRILQKEKYINEFEFVENGRGGEYHIKLLGRINNCKAIKPRYSVGKDEYNLWEKRYLPAKNFGTLIVSTPKGLMTHKEAKKAGTGGKLIAYVY